MGSWFPFSIRWLVPCCAILALIGCGAETHSPSSTPYSPTPTTPPSAFQRAVEAYRHQEYRTARQFLDNVLAAGKGTTQLYNLSGLVYQQLQEHTLSIAEFERAIQTSPTCAECYTNLAVSFEATNDSVQAQTNFVRALDLDPQLLAAHFNLGVLSYVAGDYSAAIQHLEQATRIGPDDSDSWFQLGLAYDRVQDLDRAIAAFSRVIDIEQGFDDQSFFLRGLAYLEKREHAAAETDFTSAIEKGLRTRDTFFYRGVARYHLQRDSDALGDFETSLTYDPNDADAFYYKSYILARQGNQEQARTAAQKALELDPPADDSE